MTAIVTPADRAGGHGDSSGALATAVTVSDPGSTNPGVDAVTVTNAGSGYTFPTVEFDLPDGPDGVQAQGHALMDANGAITEIVVDSPGGKLEARDVDWPIVDP